MDEEGGKPKFKGLFTNPFRKNPEQSLPRPPEKKYSPELNQQLEEEILKAFENFNEDPASTILALTNEEFAKKFAFQYEMRTRNIDITKPYSREKVQKVTDEIRRESIQLDENNEIRLLMLVPLNLESQEESGDLRSLQKDMLDEAALIYGEEVLHLLQKRKGSLTGENDPEVDVALFYKKHNIEMTDSFLNMAGRRTAVEASEKK